MPITIGDTNYTTFEDIWNDSILTPDEKTNIQQKVKRVGKLIELKEKRLPDKG
jgi:hypothetical protein